MIHFNVNDYVEKVWMAKSIERIAFMLLSSKVSCQYFLNGESTGTLSVQLFFFHWNCKLSKTADHKASNLKK